MTERKLTASILESEKTIVSSRSDVREPKPLEEVIKEAASEIVGIFQKQERWAEWNGEVS